MHAGKSTPLDTGHVTCDACWEPYQPGVKTLPCPKLRLRAVTTLAIIPPTTHLILFHLGNESKLHYVEVRGVQNVYLHPAGCSRHSDCLSKF